MLFRHGQKIVLSKYVFLKEENSISYEWHISDDGAEATLIGFCG